MTRGGTGFCTVWKKKEEKLMKKLFIAITMLVMLTVTAFAGEPATDASTCFTVGLFNPIIKVNGEDVLNLQQLDVEIAAQLSQFGVSGVSLAAKAGLNYDQTIFSGQIQWDENGITYSTDTLDQAYGVTLTEELNAMSMNVTQLLFLTTGNNSQIDLGSLTPDQLMALIEAIIHPYLKDQTIVDGDRVLSFNIGEKDGTIVLNALIGLINNVLPNVTTNSPLSLFGEEKGLGLRLKGKLFFDEKGIRMESDGDLISLKDGLITPLLQTLADDGKHLTCSINFGKNNEGRIDIEGTWNESTGEGTLVVNEYQQDTLTATMNLRRSKENSTVKHELNYGNTAGQKLEAHLSRSTDAASPALHFTLEIVPGKTEQTKILEIAYEGKRMSNDFTAAQSGHLRCSWTDGITYSMESTLVSMVNGERASDWMVDSSKAADLSNLNEEQKTQLEINLDAIVSDALGRLQRYVPGINEFLSTIEFDWTK